jgi:uncharacterized protein (TIRG00374 family)
MKISRLFLLVGIFLFVYILLNIDIGKTIQILSNANISLIILALLLLIFTVVMKALKWKMLIGMYDKGYPLGSATKAWLMGFSLSMVTPARIGDISRAYYIKHKISIGKGITTVIIDRVIDITILFCMAIIGLVSFAAFFTSDSNLFLIISVLFVLFIFGVYASTKKKLVKIFLRPVFDRIVPEKHKSSLNLTFNDFYLGLDSIKRHRKNVIFAAVLGVIIWFVSIVPYYLLALSIGLDLPYMFLLSVVPIVALLDMLPISFSGIGTRDAALILFLSFLSIGREYAISLSFLVLVFGYLLIGLAGTVIMLREHMK